MTTALQLPDWSGLTVAIIGNAPGMSAGIVDGVHADKTVAVHNGLAFAPKADLYVALDPEHHVDLAYTGPRVVGVETDDEGAMYGGMMYETVVLDQWTTVSIRNNLLAAIRLAARGGAARIILIGVDTAAYETKHSFRGLTEGLAAITAELAAQGVSVEFGPGGSFAVVSEAGGEPLTFTASADFMPGDERVNGA